MVVTFPNMGNVALAGGVLCQALQIPYVMPEENNSRTLQLGSYYAPEEICLPFKLMLGNFIQSIKKGADTVLMVGSCGPCRFGEYCELFMKILAKMGYRNLDFIVADFSSEIGMDELKRRIARISEASPVDTLDQIKALQTAYKVVDLCDKIDAAAYKLAGYEVHAGDCRRLLNEYRAQAMQCKSPDETINLLKFYQKKLNAVPIDRKKDPVKLAIIGEIFTVIDPFSNLFLEEKLMAYGAATSRMLTPSWWVRDFLLKPLKLNSLEVNRAAKQYLPYPVGGHCRECIGEAVLAKEHGMDGAIQIFPLGCMPEVIAKSILPTIQRDKDFPIMTLIVDEVTGEAGYITRIEAFLDMLISRKRHDKKQMAKPPVSKFHADMRYEGI